MFKHIYNANKVIFQLELEEKKKRITPNLVMPLLHYT